IWGPHDAELLRLLHEPHAGRVDVHRVALDLRELGPDLLEDLAPERLDRDRVRLVDERDLLTVAPAPRLVRVADDPLDTASGEDHVHRDALVRRALPLGAALATVDVLCVLADRQDADVALCLVLQRAKP